MDSAPPMGAAAPTAGGPHAAPRGAPSGAPRGAGVSVRGLRASFGTLDVLRGLDLTVAPGAFVAVVGRSGCGKSTLLRAVTGLDAPAGGQVRFDPPGARARIMFQEPRLLPWARVLDNVALGLPAGRGGDGGAKALRALQQVGLDQRAGDWPGVLSGGQKQRVALARALVSGPSVLALDEPMGALDALTRIEMQGLLERIWAEQGFTALLVTHDVPEALMLADRVVMIEHGRIGLDVAVDLPRPRRRGAPAFGALEQAILDRLLAG